MLSLPEIIKANAPKPTPKTTPKPTTESIKLARQAAESLAEKSRDSEQCLWAAFRLYECDAPAAAIKELRDARTLLVMLRRSQTAALENIDAAIASAGGGA